MELRAVSLLTCPALHSCCCSGCVQAHEAGEAGTYTAEQRAASPQLQERLRVAMHAVGSCCKWLHSSPPTASSVSGWGDTAAGGGCQPWRLPGTKPASALELRWPVRITAVTENRRVEGSGWELATSTPSTHLVGSPGPSPAARCCTSPCIPIPACSGLLPAF